MYALVGQGGPSTALDYVISQVLQRHEPTPPNPPAYPLASVSPSKKAVFDIAFHVRTRTLAVEKAVKKDTEKYTASECQDAPGTPEVPKFLRKCLWDCIGVILETLRANLEANLDKGRGAKRGEGGGGQGRGLTILLATDDAELRPEFVRRLERHGTVFYSAGQWA